MDALKRATIGALMNPEVLASLNPRGTGHQLGARGMTVTERHDGTAPQEQRDYI